MATPEVPPRPARSAQVATAPSTAPSAPSASESSTATLEPPQVPQIPPRPAGRRHDRSLSPDRDRYAQSPLNAPFQRPSDNNPYGNSSKAAFSGSNLELPQRPPSVNLPSIGQEGNEYDNYSEYEEPLSRTVSATQTSHVGTDLPLHAPKPGLSQSEARARVQGVTHSDNSVPPSPGRRLSQQLDDGAYRPLRSRGSAQLRSPSAAETERPGSAQAEHFGIPQIGIQVPMYRHAGDVQAPSPAPGHAQFPPEAGRSRHHNRTRSGRDQSNPPDSYGRHGHGVVHQDKFEKDWYAKHPEALAQEGHYSTALNGVRREYVLSSDELNKLVRNSAGAGFGTAPGITGLPDEQIGYMASEEYASRMSSRPGSSYDNAASPAAHQTKFADSLLRKVQSRDGASQSNPELSRTLSHESEIIHIDAPEQHWSKVTGEGHFTPPVDLGPGGDHGGFVTEQSYGVPILASDEVRPDSAWQKPAVPHERGSSTDLRNQFGSHSGSRPGSRPGSIHGMPTLVRFDSHGEHDVHTPLDNVAEYEPLFDDDDKKIEKPKTEVTRLKHRPDMRQRFPSQDIWEDSPDSARLETEVDTPEPEEQEMIAPPSTASTFESPEVEAARKGEPSEADRARLLSREERLAQSNFKPQIRSELRRPGPHRFPSSDVWEDSPDSARLETTVGESEEDDEEEDPAEVAGAVVNTSTERADLSSATPREGITAGGPIVPQRPIRPLKHKSSVPKETSHLSEVYTASEESSQLPIAEVQRSPVVEIRKAPSIPDRPKPQIPARPNRSDATSPEDNSSTKAKPPVPARPVGGKIAALQAGFMSDLNNRLKIGPQAPPKHVEPERSEDEPEEDKAPLEDARKGRARGPARRKPAATPAAAAVPAPTSKRMPKLSFAKPVTVWHISPKGALDVLYEAPEPPAEEIVQAKSTTVTEKALDSSDDSHVEKTTIPTKSETTPSVAATSKPDLGEDDLPGAFPTTPAAEEKSFGVSPLPASSGTGNPVSLPTGEVPPPSTQSVHNKVTLDEESYENAGTGTDAPRSEGSGQTGVKHIEVNSNTAGAQKLTIIEGGNALTGEDVVVHTQVPKDTEGHARENLA